MPDTGFEPLRLVFDRVFHEMYRTINQFNYIFTYVRVGDNVLIQFSSGRYIYHAIQLVYGVFLR